MVHSFVAVRERDRAADHGLGLLLRLGVVLGLDVRLLDHHRDLHRGAVEGHQQCLEAAGQSGLVDRLALHAVDDLDLPVLDGQARH